MKRAFIGLRLSEYELSRLQELKAALGAQNRSEALRLLIRAATMPGLPVLDLGKCTTGDKAPGVRDG